MGYVKQSWQNYPSTVTPLSADRLVHMEDGIKAADDAAVYAATSASVLAAVVAMTPTQKSQLLAALGITP